MRDIRIRFVLGAIALFLIIDIAIRLVYAIHGHLTQNRLLNEYTDNVPSDKPPFLLRITGFVISILLNLIIYYFI